MKTKVLNTVVAGVLVAAGAQAQATVVSTNSVGGIFDGSSGTRTLSVTTHGTIQDLNLTIDFAKCDNNGADGPLLDANNRCIGRGNAFDSEIVFSLTGPNGQPVSLVQQGTFSNGNTPGLGRIQLTFDDEAATAAGGKMRAGSYAPVQPLSVFDGLDMFGTWTLFVQDTRRGDPLQYFGAALDITSATVEQVPEPGTVAIVGLGLIGMGALRRRRQV